MSGIVCILHLDRSPVDPEVLQKLTDSLVFRGPDAKKTCLQGALGMGFTLLKTTAESEHEEQPFSLDGKTWIVADARIDRRDELRAKLLAKGHSLSPCVTDAELILRAYSVWSQDCVEHMVGDFAFAIWDGSQNLLFCARDQMSVRPLFYAHLQNIVIVSNTLDCIRLHPAVTEKLNERAVADYLMFGVSQDLSTSFFSDIHRLPGAHCITWSPGGVRERRYWTLPVDEPLIYRCQEDYIDQFKELLRIAVDDRLRSCRVGVYMSGGRDSTSIAATAHALLSQRGTPFALQAFTTVDSALPAEGYFAGLVAKRLDIPIDYFEWNYNLIDPDWEQRAFHTPEPDTALPLLPEYQKHHQHIASFTRVALEGEGADNALVYEWRNYLSYLFRGHRYGRFITSFIWDQVHRPRFPFWGRIVSRTKQILYRERPTPFPAWIDPDFISRAGLMEHWQEFWSWSHKASPHPVRPESYDSMLIPNLQSFPEIYDAARIMAPMEVRHPYLDLHLLRFLLAVPAIPWCHSKYLIRRAMTGVLPTEVLRRPKATVSCAIGVRHLSETICHKLSFAPEFRNFVNPTLLPLSPSDDIGDFDNSLRARIFNHWLKNVRLACIIGN